MALKVLSLDEAARPQDRIDLIALKQAASPAEIEATRSLLTMIQERGFHRDKNLQLEFDGHLNS